MWSWLRRISTRRRPRSIVPPWRRRRALYFRHQSTFRLSTRRLVTCRNQTSKFPQPRRRRRLRTRCRKTRPSSRQTPQTELQTDAVISEFQTDATTEFQTDVMTEFQTEALTEFQKDATDRVPDRRGGRRGRLGLQLAVHRDGDGRHNHLHGHFTVAANSSVQRRRGAVTTGRPTVLFCLNTADSQSRRRQLDQGPLGRRLDGGSG